MNKRKLRKRKEAIIDGVIWVSLMVTFILLLVYLGWKIGVPIFIGLVSILILFSKQKMSEKKQALKEFFTIVLVLSLFVTIASFGTVGVLTFMGLILGYFILLLLYKMFIQKKSFLEILLSGSSNSKKRGQNSSSSFPPLTGTGEDYGSHSSSSDSGGE